LSSSPLTSKLATEEQKLLACIHCGLCLEACPTYVITGDENDGPRGRLYLMRAVGEGRLSNDSQAFERHIDRCLGCRACEQVCPAGVEYGQLLEAARAELFMTQRGLGYKALRFALKHIWLHPGRLKFAFAVARFMRDRGVAGLLLKSGVARMLSRRFEFGLALLQSSSSNSGPRFKANEKQVNETPRLAAPATDNSAMLFSGCVGEGLFSRVNKATVRVLEVNGIETNVPGNQVCCGALHAHAEILPALAPSLVKTSKLFPIMKICRSLQTRVAVAQCWHLMITCSAAMKRLRLTRVDSANVFMT